MEAVQSFGNTDCCFALVFFNSFFSQAVDGLLECTNPDDPELSNRYRDFYLRILKVFQDPRSMGVQWTNKQITKYVSTPRSTKIYTNHKHINLRDRFVLSRALVECREEFRYSTEVVDLLIRSHMINLPMFDNHLVHSMENGTNYVAVGFAMQIVQHYLVEERNASLITEQDLSCTIEALVKIANHSRNPPEGYVLFC